jgi:hypothetical protein
VSSFPFRSCARCDIPTRPGYCRAKSTLIRPLDNAFAVNREGAAGSAAAALATFEGGDMPAALMARTR